MVMNLSFGVDLIFRVNPPRLSAYKGTFPLIVSYGIDLWGKLSDHCNRCRC